MHKWLLACLIISVVLVSGCSNTKQPTIDENSSTLIRLVVHTLGGLDEFYSLSNNSFEFSSTNPADGKETTYYAISITIEELSNLTNYIVSKGFFEKQFNSTDLMINRAPTYSKTLNISINNLNKNVRFGDLIITENREALDEITSRIESLVPESITEPYKECVENAVDFIDLTQTSKYNCKTDEDCVVLNESFYVYKGSKLSIVNSVFGVIDSVTKEKIQNIESEIQNVKSVCGRFLKSREVNIQYQGFDGLYTGIPSCINGGCHLR
ncbi:MAG TPA: hypothetical protein VJA47_01555 [archaeon]|nr:hypothetical protein [archaeon]